MKRLAAMQDCPLLIVRAFTAVDAAASRSALGITMKGSLPPSSSTTFLICAPAARPTETPAPSLPVSVTAAMRGSSISRATRSEPTRSVLERALGEARLAEDLLDRQGAVGDVRSVLQEPDVAGHQRRRGEAEDLPEGEVPGHHGEDRPERVVADEAAGGVGRDRLLGEEALGVLGVVPADRGALLGLSDAGADGLAHLEGHATAPLGLARLENLRGLRHPGRALGEGRPAPARELGRGERDAPLDLGVGVRLEGPEGRSGRGVDGGDGHGSSLFS